MTKLCQTRHFLPHACPVHPSKIPLFLPGFVKRRDPNKYSQDIWQFVHQRNRVGIDILLGGVPPRTLRLPVGAFSPLFFLRILFGRRWLRCLLPGRILFWRFLSARWGGLARRRVVYLGRGGMLVLPWGRIVRAWSGSRG